MEKRLTLRVLSFRQVRFFHRPGKRHKNGQAPRRNPPTLGAGKNATDSLCSLSSAISHQRREEMRSVSHSCPLTAPAEIVAILSCRRFYFANEGLRSR